MGQRAIINCKLTNMVTGEIKLIGCDYCYIYILIIRLVAK